jgi:hypothetical protein
MDFPVVGGYGPGTPQLPIFLSTWSRWSGIGYANRIAGNLTHAAITWVANYCVFMPMVIPFSYPVNRVFWVNGSTITTSNAAFAIYTRDFGQIYTTGSQAMSGASAPQFITPATPFVLPPGSYFFAWSCDNTTSRGYGSTTATAEILRFSGVMCDTSGHPPETTPTPVAPTQALAQYCGVTWTPSGY